MFRPFWSQRPGFSTAKHPAILPEVDPQALWNCRILHVCTWVHSCCCCWKGVLVETSGSSQCVDMVLSLCTYKKGRLVLQDPCSSLETRLTLPAPAWPGPSGGLPWADVRCCQWWLQASVGWVWRFLTLFPTQGPPVPWCRCSPAAPPGSSSLGNIPLHPSSGPVSAVKSHSICLSLTYYTSIIPPGPSMSVWFWYLIAILCRIQRGSRVPKSLIWWHRRVPESHPQARYTAVT